MLVKGWYSPPKGIPVSELLVLLCSAFCTVSSMSKAIRRNWHTNYKVTEMKVRITKNSGRWHVGSMKIPIVLSGTAAQLR